MRSFSNTCFLIYKIFAIVLLSFIGSHCLAQSVGPLPDSVKAVDESRDTGSWEDEGPQAKQAPDPAVIRTVPDTTSETLKNDPDFAYANDPQYWKIDDPGSNNQDFINSFLHFFTKKPVAYFIYLVIGGILIFTLYRVVVDNRLYLFYSVPKKNNTASHPDEYGGAEDLDRKIAEKMAEGDFKTAVRYMYLKALSELDNKGLVRFQAQGTDQQYLSQFNQFGRKEDFGYLVYVYEHVWFGNFELNREEAESLQDRFIGFYSSIGT